MTPFLSREESAARTASRVFLTPAEFSAMRERNAETERQRRAGAFLAVGDVAPTVKQAHAGRSFILFARSHYAPTQCDSIGMLSWDRRPTSSNPAVPFSPFTHRTTTDHHRMLAAQGVFPSSRFSSVA